MQNNLLYLRQLPAPLRVVCFIFCLLLIWLPFAVPIYLLIADSNLVSIITLIILYTEFIILLKLWGKFLYQEPRILSHYGLDFTRLNGVDLLRGLAIGLISVLVLFGLEGLLGWLEWRPAPAFLMQIILEGLLVGVGIGFAEELLFRGWLLDELQRDYSQRIATGVNAALFAIAHFIKPLAAILHTLPQFPALFLLGLTQVWAKNWRRGRLGLPIGLHAGLVWGYYIVNVGELAVYSDQVPEWVTGLNNNPLQGMMGVMLMGMLAGWMWRNSQKR
ncbi:MAG TPA: type II CAAX endopeptidase family protein [Nostocaceae cyanobacterium]|nr:type II CAAX endopeptidase family protein [Nostocaceae cyanobacterium]